MNIVYFLLGMLGVCVIALIIIAKYSKTTIQEGRGKVIPMDHNEPEDAIINDEIKGYKTYWRKEIK